MPDQLSKVLLNPIRMRILQYLMNHPVSTTTQIGEFMSDVPVASLYRHVKKLESVGVIEVVEEKQVRGAIERAYSIKENPPQDVSMEDIKQQINLLFLSLMSDFEAYFEQGNQETEMQKDMLFATTATFMMTDEEFAVFMNDLTALYRKATLNGPAPGRKQRRISTISSPPTDGS